MSNPRVVKRASGSTRGAKVRRERRAYRDECLKLEKQLTTAELVIQKQHAKIRKLAEAKA